MMSSVGRNRMFMYLFILNATVSGFKTSHPHRSIGKGLHSRLDLVPIDFSFATEVVTQFSNFFSSSTDSTVHAIETSTSILKAAEGGGLNLLGNDLLILFCTTICIVPLFQFLKASPVLGFLAAGLAMGPAGLHLFTDLNDMEALADFGVLFLLFEQGLELTVDRLKALKSYAFGYGTFQVLLSTAAFSLFPFIGGVKFLETFVRSNSELVEITRIDEAVVIGAALSLSSSAFVLKVLQEKNQLGTKFGAASLGILLLQDIAVVPLLVLLPILEDSSGPVSLVEQISLLGAVFLKAFLGLGGILFIGGKVVRFLFSIIAQTKSSETFVALCLLVALGTGALTDSLGLSSTLGAFTAGTLLAESNYRTQIESDIKPFRGLLLGLFFLTTGASVEPGVIQNEWPTVLALLAGLVGFKAVITTAIGPAYGLTLAESVRTGLLLSGGGEFAFVVLTLAGKLAVLPDELDKILVGVVVLSMALTPYLSSLGDYVADWIERQERKRGAPAGLINTDLGGGFEAENFKDAVVICGFGAVGESVARLLDGPVEQDGLDLQRKYVAFDLDPNIVVRNYKEGKSVLYGDGSLPLVLETAGVERPRALVVTYSSESTRFAAVQRLREAFPEVPIIARAGSEQERVVLLEAGASVVCCDEREASLRLAGSLLDNLGVERGIVSRICREDREESEKADIQRMELSRISRSSSNDATFTSSSGLRFNMPDSRNSFAKKFVNMAKSQLTSLLSSNSKGNTVNSLEEEGDFGESMYSIADKKLKYKEERLGGKSVEPLPVGIIAGVEGVDYCKMPEDGTS